MVLVGPGLRPYARGRMQHDEVQKLRETLATLNAELDTVESGDPEVRAMLVSALQDIAAKLDARTAATPDVAVPAEPFATESLQEVARVFEVEHPTLAATVRSIVDSLARAGI